MRSVRLANGEQYEADWCGAANGILTMNLITDESFMDIAQDFSDKTATKEIVFDYDVGQSVFKDYTNLISIQVGGWSGNGVLVALGREASE